MLQKSYMRFLGTLIGSIIAALTLTFFGNDIKATGLAIAGSILFFSYLATSEKSYSASGTLGAVTVVIILISHTAATVTGAAERFLEISIGILIAALVSQFVFPINARRHLKLMQAKTIKQIREYYIATLMSSPTQKVTVTYLELDEAIVKSLSLQRSLASESQHELIGVLFDPYYFGKVLRCEKEIFRCIVGMHYAYRSMLEKNNAFLPSSALIDFNKMICEMITKLEQQIKSKKSDVGLVVFPTTSSLKELLKLTASQFSNMDAKSLNSYLFTAERLINYLKKLKNLLTHASEVDENINND